MVYRPLQNKHHGTTGQGSSQHPQISQIEDRLMFTIESMEMRRVMIPPEHLDHDTIEYTDRRHNCHLPQPLQARIQDSVC